MNFKQVNIKTALFEQKQKSFTLLDQVADILSTSVKLDEDVLYRLQHPPVDQLLDLNTLDESDTANLFTIKEIKNICLKYC